MGAPAKKEQLSTIVAELTEAAAHGDKEAAFALAFFSGPTRGNRTESYLAINPGVERHSAHEMGSRYGQNATVKRYLSELAHSVGLTRELIIQQVTAIAGSDISELSGVDSLSELAERPAHVRAAVKRIKKTKKYHKGELVDETVELEMHSKDSALSLGSDILGLRKNQVSQGVTVVINMGADLDIDTDIVDVTPE